MTIQLGPHTAGLYGKSKKTLEDALNTKKSVGFHDPSCFTPRHGGDFTGADMDRGEKFSVVMDPLRRSRFATVERRADGSFRVT